MHTTRPNTAQPSASTVPTGMVAVHEAGSNGRDGERHRRNCELLTHADGRVRLAAENLALVHHLVRRLGVGGDEYDDAVGAGALGLLRACRDWDPTRGASLATHATPWIRQSALRHLRRARRARRDLVGDGTDPTVHDLDGVEPDGDIEDAVVRSLRARSLRDALDALDASAGATVRLFVEHLGDERAAAAAAGISIGTWRRQCDRAWSMLRHPAGPCLGSGATELAGGYRRWRVIPPAGPFAAQGACAGLGVERFFPARGHSGADADAVCAGCPVVTACARFAVDVPAVVGIWGGTSEHQRRLSRRTEPRARP